MDGEFSVCQFFPDGSYEYARRYVTDTEAMKAFSFFTTNVAAKAGLTRRVIVTDGGDCINAEWEYGKGFTFPPELVGKDPNILYRHFHPAEESN